MAPDLDSFAGRAEAFLTDLDREYHLHFSGQKPGYEVEAVYERHRGLFERTAIEALREAAAGVEGGERRRAGYLLEFSVGGYIGRACAAEESALAAREAEIELEVDGSRIPYRGAPTAVANEADAGRRRRIEEARLAALAAELNPLHLTVLKRSHELIEELGWRSYAEAFAELRGIDLRGLGEQTRAFLAATDAVYPEVIEPELQATLSLDLAETGRADLARFLRAPGLDEAFAAERLIPSLVESMAALGLDLASRPGIFLDTEERPTKSPRAYCAPVRVPDEIYLVVSRVGGREDYAALFHEGGHAQHYAAMDAGLPVEYRYLGDSSVTESFAFLIEGIAGEPAWLRDKLGADPGPVAAHDRAVRLYFLRRYAAKLAYELELRGAGADLERMPARYAELLGGATGISWSEESWLDDVDAGFYVAAYLRAWALTARWREALRAAFGEQWFAATGAGEWLQGIWRQGQRLRADELLATTTGEELRFEVLAAEFAPP